ncbi:MAG: site-specific integrase [Clostridia bacterium]|nr:site-specific integrase [Clostridia bacterium]
MPKKQKSGLYRTKIRVGVDAKGKDIFKWASGKTLREFEQSKRDIIAKYITGEAPADDQLFGQYAVQWFNVKKKPSIKDASLELYRTAMNKDILPVFGDRNLRAIRPLEIQEFVNGFEGKSESKITYVVASINGVFESAYAEGILKKNPAESVVRPQAAPAEEKRALTEAERKTVESVCIFNENGAFLACMYYLGLRPGEARGLMWGDFDWDTNQVHIQRDIDDKKGSTPGELKTKASNRCIPVPEKLRRILERKRGREGDFLFVGSRSNRPMAKTSYERMWVGLMFACDMVIPLEEQANNYRASDIRSRYKPVITAHTLRHNYITMCWENGIDPFITQKLVGHTSIKTTMDIYTHLSEKQLQKAAAMVDDMFTEGRKKRPEDQLKMIADILREAR